MSRTARTVAVLALLCCVAVTTSATGAEGHLVSAAAPGSINWDTVPESAGLSINWD
ncbi:hypothetical protein [Streptomyces sp. NPDC056452]|uniref:hypothetical protein n=1 Tax=Streptomyces sp. NPDC056452 TaxID=3345821 RepID=UPI0036C28B4D